MSLTGIKWNLKVLIQQLQGFAGSPSFAEVSPEQCAGAQVTPELQGLLCSYIIIPFWQSWSLA